MAIRIVYNSPYNSHTERLFKNAGVLPLSYLIEFFILQIVQQFTQGFLPISFNNTWVSNATVYVGKMNSKFHLEMMMTLTFLLQERPKLSVSL